MDKEIIYLIASLRNPEVRTFAQELRSHGFEVFEDWHAAGERADDIWQEYEQGRGHSYLEALQGWHAKMVFDFDYTHLSRAGLAVLMYPAGKSSHLELGFMLGRGKRGYILLDKEPERWDVMTKFATGIFLDKQKLIEELKNPGKQWSEKCVST